MTKTRRVERVMGTAVVFDVRGEVAAEAISEAVDYLHWVDATFSVYRRSSEISGVSRGELSIDDASPEVREVLTRCGDLRVATDGWFEHEPRFPGARTLDPSGYVKGWAIDRAAQILLDGGAKCLSIAAGGDLVAIGRPDGVAPWRVAIQHPARRDAISAVVGVDGGAVATSGRYERGPHIWQHGGIARSALSSMTVVGPELGTADALATALFAAGDPTGGDWFERFPGYGIIAVDAVATMWASPAIDLLPVRRDVA